MKFKKINYLYKGKKNFYILLGSIFFLLSNFFIDFSTYAAADYIYKVPPKKPGILFNMHIGKTGGSTLNMIITSHFEESSLCNCLAYFLKYYPYMAIRKINEHFYFNLPEEKKKNFKYAGGHVGLEVLNYIPKEKNAKAIALVREPKSLILSSYWYYLKNHGQKNVLFKTIDISTLEESLIDFINIVNYNNSSIRWFSRNNKIYDNNVPITEEIFQEIKNNIKDDFLFVGLSNKFDESIIALRRIMEWNFDEKLFYKRQNETEFKMPESSYSDSVLDAVSERFAYEQKLYNWLEKRFDSLTKVLGKDFKEEVRIYKRLNYLYSRPEFKHEFKRQLKLVQSKYPWAKQNFELEINQPPFGIKEILYYMAINKIKMCNSIINFLLCKPKKEVNVFTICKNTIKKLLPSGYSKEKIRKIFFSR